MKQRNVIYVRVLMVVLAIVILVVFTTRTPQHTHRDAWLPSSFNPVGAGNLALFDTLQDLHWHVDRWREPLSRLANHGPGDVLVITRSRVGSPPVSFTEQETDLLDDWVREGNTLVLLGAMNDWDDTRDLLREFGFSIPTKTENVAELWSPFVRDSGETFEAEPTAAAKMSSKLVLPDIAPLPVPLPPKTTVLWQLEGSPYLVDIARGSGHVVYGASERLLSNSFLNKGDNLAVVLHLLTPGGTPPHELFFEESHHGYSAVFALVRLWKDPGIQFAGMLTLLGTLAFFGGSLVRFGPVVPLHRATGRSTLEFVDSIAELYMRADLRDDTIKYLFNETHQQILHRLNLPPTASHELIASRLQLAHPHLPKWKKLAQRFDSNDYVQGLPPAGWLRVAKDLIEIKTAMA